MEIETRQLAQELVANFKNEIESEWPEIQQYVEEQMTLLAGVTSDFILLYQTKQINQEQFKTNLKQIELTVQMTLITQTGLEEIMLAKGWQAARQALYKFVGAIVGVKLV